MIQIEKKSISAISAKAVFNPFVSCLTFVLFLFSVNPGIGFASTSVDDIRNYLNGRTELDGNDFSKVESGRLISKLLPASNKREVAVFGIVPLNVGPDAAFQAFQESMVRQNGKSRGDFGDFSSSPRAEDLQNLMLEPGDVEDLKNCQIGSCDVKLSAAMIERFQKEVDWNAADYARQANDLYRRIILEYVQDYLARGNAALIEYHDKREPIDLAEENGSLLQKAVLINDFAPELARYLQDFPRSPSPNISQTITWAKVKFGLKPVIIITQTINYRPANPDGAGQIYSVTKQIYANHYFDSSLGLTTIIEPQKDGKAAGSYLFYANYSRSDALGGILGKFARDKVEKEAVDKLETLLQTSKYLAESKSAPPLEASAFTTQSVLEENYFLWLVTLPFAALALWIGIRMTGKVNGKR